MNISIIGMPLFYGCDRPGVDQGPKILRENKVIDILERKHNVIDLGDISVPFLDAKEKFFTNPKMKYLNEVIECNTSFIFDLKFSSSSQTPIWITTKNPPSPFIIIHILSFFLKFYNFLFSIT